MFYTVAVHLIKIIFRLFNGGVEVHGLDNIPTDKPVIFAGTHRSMTDPFYIADVVYPRRVAFMAKDSIFKFKPLAYLLTKGNVFGVNREKPSAKSVKHAVRVLTKEHLNLGIFPSGTRYSTDIKSGTSMIQGLSKADIVPFVIQGPVGFWQFIARKKAKIMFGEAIRFEPDVKYNKTTLEQVDAQLASVFTQLDLQLDPKYQYIVPVKKHRHR